MLVVCVHVMCVCVRLNERTDARMRTEIKSLGKRWEKRIEGGHSRPIGTIATDSSEPKRQHTITQNKHRPNAVAEQTGAAAGANTKKVGSIRLKIIKGMEMPANRLICSKDAWYCKICKTIVLHCVLRKQGLKVKITLKKYN